MIYDDQGVGVVVDPGNDAPRILAAIQKQSLTIRHILLTHTHFDHILAAAEVQAATGATLLVPQEDEPALHDPKRSLLRFMGGDMTLSLHADRLLAEGDTVKAGGLTIEVLHTPGHTPGGSCYVCGDLLVTGDTLFAGDIGRTDFPGGDSAALRRSLHRLSRMEGDYTVLPGHGPQTTLSAEKQYNPYMK